jgi:hypothetical protein
MKNSQVLFVRVPFARSLCGVAFNSRLNDAHGCHLRDGRDNEKTIPAMAYALWMFECG